MLANLTWPGLVLEQGILSWRVIALGFLLEYGIVRLVFSFARDGRFSSPVSRIWRAR